jgi:drug/metabolite transporter (DMT)-like permease
MRFPSAPAAVTRLAVAALMVNALVWGLSWWPFRALQNYGLHPLWATAMVYALVTVCILLARPMAWRGVVQHRAMWLLALGSGLTNICFNWAVTEGDVVRVVLLFYLMPAWTVLLAWCLLGERAHAVALVRLVVALVGVLLVLKTPGSAWPLPQSLPDYLALMGGFSFALVNVMLLKLRDTPAASRMLSMFCGGAVMSAAMALWGGVAGWVPAVPVVQADWVGVLLGLTAAFLLGNLSLQYGAAHLRSGTTALIMLSEIVFATLSSVLLGAAVLDARTLAGGALILMAAASAALVDKQAQH